MNLLRTGLLSLLVAAAACGSQSDADTAEGGPAGDSVSTATSPTAPNDEWAVSMEGSGPFRIGASLAELAPHLAADIDTTTLQRECDYVRAAEAPDSMLFMIEGGRLARIDVTGTGPATAEGAHVGDAESRILELYPSAVRGPHKYTDGAYLTVTGSDGVSKYVFETDGQRVTRYRAGVAPAVDYVEGCS